MANPTATEMREAKPRREWRASVCGPGWQFSGVINKPGDLHMLERLLGMLVRQMEVERGCEDDD